MVANMSISGSGVSRALDDAVSAADRAGVVMIGSAGNSRSNACSVSPAAGSGCIAVGSTAENDSRSNFSNFGSCIAVFAPGTNILSAAISNDRASTLRSGTSMVGCEKETYFFLVCLLLGGDYGENVSWVWFIPLLIENNGFLCHVRVWFYITILFPSRRLPMWLVQRHCTYS